MLAWRRARCWTWSQGSAPARPAGGGGGGGGGGARVAVRVGGETLQFPAVWLRDNCRCPRCYHPTARSRRPDARPRPDARAAAVACAGDAVTVTWDDGHASRYDAAWLAARAFTPAAQRRYADSAYRPPRRPWHGREFTAACARHDYAAVLGGERARLAWLRGLCERGVSLVENAPPTDTALDDLVRTIAFPRQTHYGVKFVVKNVPNTSNVAYLSGALPLHTDLPYYAHCPGVNMLHVRTQTAGRGGDSLLADALYAAQHMRAHHPAEYRLLTTVDVEWRDVGTEDGMEFHKLYRSPVICLDRHSEIERINFSIPQRGSHFPGSIDEVDAWYSAHKLFFDLNHEFSAKFKTKTGDILIFDNIRLLHGRSAYEDTTENVRTLIGTYVDWDEIYSRFRCLNVKLNKVSGI